ncbi:Cyanate permease [Desulfuromusa kysingii]|uniref:Cyanate permease n=1 Tax=Desulfuromusa kysingii TaxID=37625 RepID=A0A1H3YSJ5_9BACT|nr:MFS transporter [Desulfuromusa kysingii]SEA14529.1 Cyanate permease [Desulfuromusa kysingii]
MRIMIIFSALLMQICLGATYSWSVYVQQIKAIAAISQTQAQIPFSVFYFVFPLTMIFSGSLVDRIGPRRAAIGGGILFGGGWIISSFGMDNFTYTILGNGVIAGIGAGIAYIVPISTCIKWFPENKGLITGIAVAGFGGGAALVSTVAGFLLKLDMTPFSLFGYFGLVFTALIVFAGFFMQNPPGFSKVATVKVAFYKTITDKRFIILYFAMFTGLAAGFAVNANIKELYQSATLMSGVSAVSFFALANAAGRVIWGGIFDRFNTSTVIQLNLISQAILLFAAPFILISSTGLQMFAILTGFNYGGILVIYAGSVARIWGADKVNSIYGWMFSANIPGAVAPLFAGFYYDLSGSFTIPMAVIGTIIMVALITMRLNKNSFTTGG